MEVFHVRARITKYIFMCPLFIFDCFFPLLHIQLPLMEMVSSVVLKDMNRMGLYLSFIDYKSIFLCVTYLFIKFYVINPQNSPGTCIIH